jgi:hypothetical protein
MSSEMAILPAPREIEGEFVIAEILRARKIVQKRKRGIRSPLKPGISCLDFNRNVVVFSCFAKPRSFTPHGIPAAPFYFGLVYLTDVLAPKTVMRELLSKVVNLSPPLRH